MDHQTPHLIDSIPGGIIKFPVEHTEAPGGVLVCRDFRGTVYSQFKADHDRVGCPAVLEADAERILGAPPSVPVDALLSMHARRVPVGSR